MKMKMRRVLSLAVVLAMALAVTPMLGISAGAQELTTVAGMLGATPVWTMPEATWGAGPVSAAVFGDGWSSNGQFLVENGALILGRNANSGELNSPGYACGADTIVIEMNLKRGSGFDKNFTYRLGFKDANGIEAGCAYIQRDITNSGQWNPWGFPSYDKIHSLALVIENDYENNKHTNHWYLDGKDVTLQSGGVEGNGLPKSGTVNGFGSIEVTKPSYGFSDNKKKIDFTNLTISAKYPTEQNERTVKGALDEIRVAKLAKNKVELPTSTTDGTVTAIENITWKSGSPDIINSAGEVVSYPDKVTAVTLTPSCEFDGKTVEGNPKTVRVFPGSLAGMAYEHDGQKYLVGSENLLDEKLNTSFSGDNWNKGWTAGDGKSITEDNFANLTDGDVSYIKAKKGGGSSTVDAIVTTVSDFLTVEKEYIVTFMVSDLPNNSNLAQWRKIFNNTEASGTQICSGITALDGWERKVYYFKAADASLRFQFSYLNSSGEFTDFAVYELTPAPTAAPKASLGWEDGRFTLDFVPGENNDATGITIYGADSDGSFVGAEAVGHAETTDGVMLTTGASNRIYKAIATIGKGVVEGAESAPVSLYQLVVNDIAANADVYKGDQKEHLDAVKVAAANAVIAAGGVYYSEGNALTNEGEKLFKTPVVDGDTVTVEINDNIRGFGIGFVLDNESKFYFGSAGTEATVSNADGAGKVFYKLTIKKNGDKYEVTLSDAPETVGLEAVTLSLDSTNIEFVEKLITEIEAGGVEAEADFVPEI